RRQLHLPRLLPRPGDAGFLFAVCLSGMWFLGVLIALWTDDLAANALLTQVLIILLPTLAYAGLLRQTAALDWRATFSLRRPDPIVLGAAPFAAVAGLVLTSAFAKLVDDS